MTTPVQIRLAEEVDKQKWDAYIRSDPEGLPYHTWAWGKAVRQAYGFKPYYLLAENDKGIAGVLPAVHLRFPLLVNELVSLPYCDVGSCLCDNPETAEAIIRAFMLLGKKLRTDRMLLRGSLGGITPSAPFVPIENNKVRMMLQLPGSSGKLMKSFKSKLRSQIRKAEKNGLSFAWGEENVLDDFYTVFSRNMHDLGSPVHSYDFFKAVCLHFKEKAKIGLVYLDDKPVGAGLILTAGKTVTIPWASTLREHNRLAPNMLLYWNFLQYSADNGFRCFDFGRSTMGEGTYKFKAQWGAKPVRLNWHMLEFGRRLQAERNSAPGPARNMIAGLWPRIPIRTANYLGSRMRKYISL